MKEGTLHTTTISVLHGSSFFSGTNRSFGLIAGIELKTCVEASQDEAVAR